MVSPGRTGGVEAARWLLGDSARNGWFLFVISSPKRLFRAAANLLYAFVVFFYCPGSWSHARKTRTFSEFFFFFELSFRDFGNRSWKCHGDNMFEHHCFVAQNHFRSFLPAQSALDTRVLRSSSCRSLQIQLKSGVTSWKSPVRMIAFP